MKIHEGYRISVHNPKGGMIVDIDIKVRETDSGFFDIKQRERLLARISTAIRRFHTGYTGD